MLHQGIQQPFHAYQWKQRPKCIVHKSCALAAQNFMLAIGAQGYDTCPMEGFDPILARKALGLPKGAELNMIVAVGKGTPEGIHGERKRLPYNDTVIIH